MIRNVRADDAPLICDIYNHYVLRTPITFEEIPVAASAKCSAVERNCTHTEE